MKGCLDQLGAIRVSDGTQAALVEFATRGGDLRIDDRGPSDQARQRVAEVLQLVAVSPEFQRA